MTEQPTGQPTDQPNDQPNGRPTPGSTPTSTPKRLVRSRSDRMVAGVCGGVADYLGIDATLVRILVVVGTIFGFGSLIIAYLIGWVLIPEEY